MEILRADDAELFTKFGQVYVSATYPGVVKAWHYHKVQVDNFACVAGMVKLVLVDTRPGSPTEGAVNEFFVGIAEPDAGAGAEPGLPRLEVHRRRSRRWSSTRRPSRTATTTRTSTASSPTATLPYDWSRRDG